MHKRVILAGIIVIVCAGSETYGQASNEEAAIKEVIQKLFKAMQIGDSTAAQSVFADQVTTATAFRNKDNNAVLHRENSVKNFLVAIGTPHKETWYEEIWNMKIQVDGDLAQAWCDYAFYADNNFSHCGVDAFQLHKTKDGWKIFHLADTRRKSGCNIPEEIQKKHQ